MTLPFENEALEIMSEQRAGVLGKDLDSVQQSSQGSLCYSNGIRGRESSRNCLRQIVFTAS